MCAVTVIAAAGTISMMEPVLALHLQSLGMDPAGRTLFGIGAVASAIAHPVIGRLTDRLGAGRLMLSVSWHRP